MRAIIAALLIVSISHSGISKSIEPPRSDDLFRPFFSDDSNQQTNGLLNENNLEDETSDAEYSSEIGGSDSVESSPQDIDLNQVVERLLDARFKRLQDEAISPSVEDSEESNGGISSQDSMSSQGEEAAEQEDNDDKWHKLIAQARALSFLQRLRAMTEQNNKPLVPSPAMFPGILPVGLPQQSEEFVPGVFDNMRGFPDQPARDEQAPLVNLMDATETGMQDELFNGQSTSAPDGETAETGGVAVVLVPVWKIIEKTVYFVIRQPQSDPNSTGEEPFKAVDSMVLFILVLSCFIFAAGLIMLIYRAYLLCRQRRFFAHQRTSKVAPPMYVQPSQHTAILNTKIDGSNIISEKPSLDHQKV